MARFIQACGPRVSLKIIISYIITTKARREETRAMAGSG